jgi:membrane-associated protease RseP (regulator of RpoE activity)
VAPVVLPSVVFAIRRESAVLEIAVASDQIAPAPVETGTSGIVWESPQPGFRVSVVRPGSHAAAAGIQAGDRVMRLGQVLPTTLDQARRALDARAESAVFVEVERAGRRRGALVPRDAR